MAYQKKSNIILVNPDAKGNRDIPNIGLAYIATYLNAEVIDLNTLLKPRNRFLTYQTDILGISVQSRALDESLRIANLYKKKYPVSEIKSVSGVLDIQCCYPYLKLNKDIYFDEPFDDTLSFPNYELFDSFDLFERNWQKGIWSYAIMTSQGCPYHCIYCQSKERVIKARSIQNCYEELKQAKERWKIKSFLILDDCFNLDKRRVIGFCELISHLNLRWSCANGLRADRFDEDIALAMRGAGCSYISFGIESADGDILKAIRKDETIEQIEKAIDIAKRHFFGVNGFFIIGLPNSSYEKDLYSLNWSKRIGINAHFSYYMPYEKLTKGNHLFYGKSAHPLSQAYPPWLQRKIYKMTEYMRPHSLSAKYWLKRQINQIFMGLIK